MRPALWLFVFSGFQNVFGVAILPPYDTYVEYRVYMVPGLAMMVCLFNGMQSSLAMVYDREMGVMRLLLTTPLPRAYLLGCKLAGTTFLSAAAIATCLMLKSMPNSIARMKKASACSTDRKVVPASLQPSR